MKRNTFYILFGIIALAEVAIFWISVELKNALYIQVAFVLGVLVLYLARRQITEVIEDERSALITQKASMRTLEIFWVVFFVLSLGSAVFVFGERVGIPPPRPPHWIAENHQMMDVGPFGYLAIIQMALLCLMVLLYVGFRMYYARDVVHV